MTALEKIKSIVGRNSDKTYKYECVDCATQFEGSDANPNFLDCPECGSDRVHSAV